MFIKKEELAEARRRIKRYKQFIDVKSILFYHPITI